MQAMQDEEEMKKIQIENTNTAIENYRNGINERIEEIKQTRTEPKSFYRHDKPMSNVEKASVFGSVEDSLDEDIANDRVINEYKQRLEELTDERDITKSSSITDALDFYESLETAINGNDSLSEDEKATARKKLWEDFASYTSTIDEESYKSKSR